MLARVGNVIFWFACFLSATINFETTILLCVIGIGCACQQLLAISADFEKQILLTSERIL
jgi:hypothetical protein